MGQMLGKVAQIQLQKQSSRRIPSKFSRVHGLLYGVSRKMEHADRAGE